MAKIETEMSLLQRPEPPAFRFNVGQLVIWDESVFGRVTWRDRSWFEGIAICDNDSHSCSRDEQIKIKSGLYHWNNIYGVKILEAEQKIKDMFMFDYLIADEHELERYVERNQE